MRLSLSFPRQLTEISQSANIYQLRLLIINSEYSSCEYYNKSNRHFYMQTSILNEKQRDRLFGKQITNILDSKLLSKNPKAGFYSRRDRGISEDIPKRAVGQKTTRPAQLPTLRNNSSMRQPAPQPSLPQAPSLHLDPQCVPDYFQQNLQFMAQQQLLLSPPPTTTLTHQKDLNENMRMILLDWLVDVHLKLKFFPQTLFLTCNLIDRYLARKDVQRSRLQLLGATCMFIAAKYQETYEVPQISDLVGLCARAFTREEFLEMEANILKVLEFALVVDTGYRFYQAFGKVQGVDPKGCSLGRMLLEASLFDMRMMKYRPSLMAASAMYLVNKLKKKQEAWEDKMIAATGYEEDELKACAKELLHLLEGLPTHNYAKNLRRKFSLTAYHEVSKQKYDYKIFQ